MWSAWEFFSRWQRGCCSEARSCCSLTLATSSRRTDEPQGCRLQFLSQLRSGQVSPAELHSFACRAEQFRLPATGGGALARPSSGLHPGLRARSRVPKPDRAGLGPTARSSKYPEFVEHFRLSLPEAAPGPTARAWRETQSVVDTVSQAQSALLIRRRASAQREPKLPPSGSQRQRALGVENSCSINAGREQRASRPGRSREEGGASRPPLVAGRRNSLDLSLS